MTTSSANIEDKVGIMVTHSFQCMPVLTVTCHTIKNISWCWCMFQCFKLKFSFSCPEILRKFPSLHNLLQILLKSVSPIYCLHLITYCVWDKMATSFHWNNIFKQIFFNENCCILTKISQKLLPRISVNKMSTLVHTMAWHQTGNKPLYKTMMS